MIDPQEIFRKAQLQPGMHVADLGCGKTGHLVFPAANIIGEKGMVFAVDVMKDVLQEIEKRSALSKHHNIHPIWSDVERLGATAIPEKSLDIVFLVNTLVQSNNRHAMLEEARRLLKDKARLVIIDWSRKGLPFGPSDDRFVDLEEIKNWSTMHGFALQEEFDMGNYHRGMVLYKHE